MRPGIGQDVLQDGHIGHHGRTRHAGEPHGHQGEQLRPGQPVQIGADEDRPLHLPHEDGGGGGQGRRSSQAQRLLEQEAEAPRDPFQDLPVPEQGGQGADHQDHRQHPEGEHEHRLGPGQGIGGIRLTGEIAEHEGGAGLGGRSQGLHPGIDGPQHAPGLRQAEQHQDQQSLHQQRSDHQPEGKPAPVLRQGPTEQHDPGNADQTLKISQCGHGVGGRPRRS